MDKVKKIYVTPEVSEIHSFINNLFIKGQLSAECSVVCLIYVERLMVSNKSKANGESVVRIWKTLVVFDFLFLLSPSNLFHCLCHVSPLILKQLKQVFFFFNVYKYIVNILDSFYHTLFTLHYKIYFFFFNVKCFLQENAGIEILASNWRPIMLCGLLLASKVWQDLSTWNVEFESISPDFTLKSINRLERTFLKYLRYSLFISGTFSKIEKKTKI